MSDREYEIPNDDFVLPDDIHPKASLEHANLSSASLVSADLSGGNLEYADLSGTNLKHANLSGANLEHANLSEADLSEADLSGARLFEANLLETGLRGADLSKADLRADLRKANLSRADLSGADLTHADLSEALLFDTIFTDAKLSRNTDIGRPDNRIKKELPDEISKERQYDIIARTNHELREAYSGSGLISQARKTRVRERRARRREAMAEGGLRGTSAWTGSLLSRVFTGYGVQLWPIVGWMLVLYLLSAGYYCGGMEWDHSLYYSVVTFTTAPPSPPPPGLPSVVAGIETFAGTAAIVVLGYVLGSRERI